MYLILLLLSSAVFATDVQVTYGLSQYSLKTSDKEIHLTGKDLDLSLGKTDCNKEMYQEFVNEVSRSMKRMDIYKTKNDEAVKIEGEGKLSYATRRSSEGRYFLGLPDKFKNLKIKDSLKCKK